EEAGRGAVGIEQDAVDRAVRLAGQLVLGLAQRRLAGPEPPAVEGPVDPDTASILVRVPVIDASAPDSIAQGVPPAVPEIGAVEAVIDVAAGKGLLPPRQAQVAKGKISARVDRPVGDRLPIAVIERELPRVVPEEAPAGEHP